MKSNRSTSSQTLLNPKKAHPLRALGRVKARQARARLAGRRSIAWTRRDASRRLLRRDTVIGAVEPADQRDEFFVTLRVAPFGVAQRRTAYDFRKLIQGLAPGGFQPVADVRLPAAGDQRLAIIGIALRSLCPTRRAAENSRCRRNQQWRQSTSCVARSCLSLLTFWRF